MIAILAERRAEKQKSVGPKRAPFFSLLFLLHIWLLGVRIPSPKHQCAVLSRCVIRRRRSMCSESVMPVSRRSSHSEVSFLSFALCSQSVSQSQSRSVGRFVCEEKGEGARGVNTAALARSRRDRSPTTTREPGHPVVCVTLVRGASFAAVTWVLHFLAFRPCC